MLRYPLPSDDKKTQLTRFDCFDRLGDAGFDDMTSLAAELFGGAVCFVLDDGSHLYGRSHFFASEIDGEAPHGGETVRDFVESLLDPLQPAFPPGCDLETPLPRAHRGLELLGLPLFVNGLLIGAMGLARPLGTPALTQEQVRRLLRFRSIANAQLATQRTLTDIDSLTGLPNRYRFFRDLVASLDAARLAGQQARHAGVEQATDLERDEAPDGASTRRFYGAGDDRRDWVVVVDICELSTVATMVRVLGHRHTDIFLMTAAKTMRGLLPSDVTLYHVGMSRFAMILPQADDHSLFFLDMLSTRLRETALIADVPVQARVGIGVSEIGVESSDPVELLRAAITAAHDAAENRQNWTFYNVSPDEVQKRAFVLLSALPQALHDGDQLSLEFQPRIDMRTGVCTAAEALLRWRHPTLGRIPPGEFISLVENTPLMPRLTDWVLDNALAQCAAWRDQGHELVMAVNISATDLDDPHFIDRLRSALEKHGVPSSLIELEFTESMLINRAERPWRHLDALSALGIGIAIDDFGSGYSNLAYLKQIPATVVKIDQFFIRSLIENAKDQIIVKTMIDLFHTLGYRVVAEGIETTEIMEMIEHWGGDEGQGYFIARPLSVENFSKWQIERAVPESPGVAAPIFEMAEDLVEDGSCLGEAVI